MGVFMILKERSIRKQLLGEKEDKEFLKEQEELYL